MLYIGNLSAGFVLRASMATCGTAAAWEANEGVCTAYCQELITAGLDSSDNGPDTSSPTALVSALVKYHVPGYPTTLEPNESATQYLLGVGIAAGIPLLIICALLWFYGIFDCCFKCCNCCGPRCRRGKITWSKKTTRLILAFGFTLTGCIGIGLLGGQGQFTSASTTSGASFLSIADTFREQVSVSESLLTQAGELTCPGGPIGDPGTLITDQLNGYDYSANLGGIGDSLQKFGDLLRNNIPQYIEPFTYGAVAVSCVGSLLMVVGSMFPAKFGRRCWYILGKAVIMLQVQLFAISLFTLLAVSLLFADFCHPNPEANFIPFKNQVSAGLLSSGGGSGGGSILQDTEIDAMLNFTLFCDGGQYTHPLVFTDSTPGGAAECDPADAAAGPLGTCEPGPLLLACGGLFDIEQQCVGALPTDFPAQAQALLSGPLTSLVSATGCVDPNASFRTIFDDALCTSFINGLAWTWAVIAMDCLALLPMLFFTRFAQQRLAIKADQEELDAQYRNPLVENDHSGALGLARAPLQGAGVPSQNVMAAGTHPTNMI